MIRHDPPGSDSNFPLRKILALATFDFHLRPRLVSLEMQPVKGLTLEKGEGGEEKREKKRAILNETASITWGSSFHKEMTRYTPFLRDKRD